MQPVERAIEAEFNHRTRTTQREIAADRSLIGNAVEELLRIEPPSPVQGRWTTRETERHGVTIPADVRVLLLTGAAHRDERQFPDPNRFDIHRKLDRTAAVDVYLAINSLKEADEIIEELRKLEGAEGPSYLFSQSLRDVAGLKPGSGRSTNGRATAMSAMDAWKSLNRPRRQKWCSNCISSSLSAATFASQSLKGSALGEGMD
mgnify:CR=1 FL=1